MADVAKLAEELLGLTILEAKELNDILEEKGIKPAAAAVAVAGPAAGGDAGGAAAEDRMHPGAPQDRLGSRLSPHAPWPAGHA